MNRLLVFSVMVFAALSVFSCAPQVRFKNSYTKSSADFGLTSDVMKQNSVTWDIFNIKNGSTTDYKSLTASGSSYSSDFTEYWSYNGNNYYFPLSYTGFRFVTFSKYTIELNASTNQVGVADIGKRQNAVIRSDSGVLGY